MYCVVHAVHDTHFKGFTHNPVTLCLQVCPFVQHPGEKPIAVRLQFLEYFINLHRQQSPKHREQQGTAFTLSPSPDSSAAAAAINISLERHWQVDTCLEFHSIKERSIFLAPLLTALVKRIAGKCHSHYNLEGAGNLATTVIRMLKAWTKYGLEELLPPTPKFPGFVWEVLVLYVLEQQCQALGSAAAVLRYGPNPHQRLNLLMDVLQCAAECFGPAGPDGRTPIALTDYYAAKDLELFRETWGRPDSVTPWIIHPADPSNNCARWTPFGNWEVVAKAAGELHQQLQQLRQGLSSHQQGAVGSDAVVDAWQLVRDATTLGRAVKKVAAEHAAVQ